MDQKRVKSAKERIVNIPVMVRQWFPHTDEQHERHNGEVIERVSFHIKIRVRNCRKQEENEIFMQQEKMSINSLHQCGIQNECEGERTQEKVENAGERDYKERMTKMSHDQIIESHLSLLQLNKRRRKTNNDRVDLNT